MTSVFTCLVNRKNIPILKKNLTFMNVHQNNNAPSKKVSTHSPYLSALYFSNSPVWNIQLDFFPSLKTNSAKHRTLLRAYCSNIYTEVCSVIGRYLKNQSLIWSLDKLQTRLYCLLRFAGGKKMKNVSICVVLFLVTSSVFVETLYLRDRPTRIERNINR